MNRIGLGALAVVAALVASACAGGGDDGAGLEFPRGGNDVLVRYEVGGGFLPMEFSLTQMPTLVVYGDGTVLVQAAGGEHGRFGELTLSESDLRALLAGLVALDLGQFPEDVQPEGPVMVADAPSTVIELRGLGEADAIASAYALGFDGMDFPAPLLAARDLLEDLATRARRDGQEWEPAAGLLLVVGPGEGGDARPWPDGVEVPGAVAAANFQDPVRVTLDGAQLAAVRDVLGTRPGGTLQTVDGHGFQVAWRPLLPHEDATS